MMSLVCAIMAPWALDWSDWFLDNWVWSGSTIAPNARDFTDRWVLPWILLGKLLYRMVSKIPINLGRIDNKPLGWSYSQRSWSNNLGVLPLDPTKRVRRWRSIFLSSTWLCIPSMDSLNIFCKSPKEPLSRTQLQISKIKKRKHYNK
jgi:hypothetical protein